MSNSASSIIVIVIADFSTLYSSFLGKAVNFGEKMFSPKLGEDMKIMRLRILRTDSSYMSYQLSFLWTLQETYSIKNNSKDAFSVLKINKSALVFIALTLVKQVGVVMKS